MNIYLPYEVLQTPLQMILAIPPTLLILGLMAWAIYHINKL